MTRADRAPGRRPTARSADRRRRRARRAALRSGRPSRRGPSSGVFRPVPNSASTTMSRRSTSAPCSSQSWRVRTSTTSRPRRPRMSRFSARVAADVGRGADDEDLHVDAALPEHARHDEPVAAVVAAAAEHRDARLAQVVERGLHRRHDLPAGVLHQHDRRDADLLDRPAIGLAHLVGVQDAHGHAPAAAAAPSPRGLRALYHKRYGTTVPAPAAVGAGARHGRQPACPQWPTSTGASCASRTRRSRCSTTGSCTAKASTRSIRTYDGEPFLLDRHFRRLRTSASMIALDVGDDGRRARAASSARRWPRTARAPARAAPGQELLRPHPA